MSLQRYGSSVSRARILRRTGHTRKVSIRIVLVRSNSGSTVGWSRAVPLIPREGRADQFGLYGALRGHCLMTMVKKTTNEQLFVSRPKTASLSIKALLVA